MRMMRMIVPMDIFLAPERCTRFYHDGRPPPFSQLPHRSQSTGNYHYFTLNTAVGTRILATQPEPPVGGDLIQKQGVQSRPGNDFTLAGKLLGTSTNPRHPGRTKSNGLPAAVLSGSLEAPPVARQWAPGRDCALVATKELPAARQAAGSRVVSGCELVPDWGFRASVAGCSDRSVDLDPAFENTHLERLLATDQFPHCRAAGARRVI